MSKHPVQKPGHLKRYLSKEHNVRGSVVVMTDLLEDRCRLQQFSPSSAVALGRLLVGSVLVASQLKDDQAISFQISGSNKIKKIFAHAQYDGLCRGYISETMAPLTIENENLSLKPLIGDGFLQASTYIPNQKQPHRSQLELQSGEIGEDLAYYLNQSRQIPCVVSLAVKITGEGRISAAGGVLVELMPGHTEETLQLIEQQQKLASPLSSLIENKVEFPDLLKNHLGEIPVTEVLSQEVNYGCTCSREKAADSLQMLEKTDFEEIIQSKENLNVDCEMCGLTYSFPMEEIHMIYKKSGKASVH